MQLQRLRKGQNFPKDAAYVLRLFCCPAEGNGGGTSRLSGTKKAPVSENQETGTVRPLLICWWTRQESNLEPAGYEPEALPIELRVRRKNLLCPVPVFCQDNFFERKTRMSPRLPQTNPGFSMSRQELLWSAQSLLPCEAISISPACTASRPCTLAFLADSTPHAKLPCAR